MNGYAPIARIIIRYGVGIFTGTELAGLLADDPDVVNYAALAIGAAVAVVTEYAYAKAKALGWAT